MKRAVVAATMGVALLGGCSDDTGPDDAAPGPAIPTGTTSAPPEPSVTQPTDAPTVVATLERVVSPGDLDVRTAVAAVEQLAGEIGPRPGTSEAYFEAALWAEQQLTRSGWSVERQRFATPAGVSWGVPVDAGPSVNLIATRGDVVPGRPWLLVGAHLDTVPQAPGAEDNASGVGTVLAVAEALDERATRLPVVLVLFGSEEPRGDTDDDHHYGSRAYVSSLDDVQRATLRAMVSLDRVGVGDVVPVGSAGEPNSLTDQLQAAGERAGVPTTIDVFQQSSDHWSFVRDGLPGARLGSTPYAGYHSADDVPSVVDRAQLRRVGRLLLAWLAGR